jgi:hypothetical protein
MEPVDDSRLRALESTVTGLKGVRSARAHQDNAGNLRVRVLVVPEKGTETVKHEVHSVMSRMDLDFDPQGVEVLRVAEAVLPTGQVRRRKLSSLTTHRSDGNFGARVMLDLGGDVLVGEADRPAVAPIEYRLVAEAVLAGVTELVPGNLGLGSVEIVQFEGSRFVVVTVIVDSRMLVGSAMAQYDEHAAIARAVLDALNRVIGRSALEVA